MNRRQSIVTLTLKVVSPFWRMNFPASVPVKLEIILDRHRVFPDVQPVNVLQRDVAVQVDAIRSRGPDDHVAEGRSVFDAEDRAPRTNELQISFDARIIAATNRDLEDAVEKVPVRIREGLLKRKRATAARDTRRPTEARRVSERRREDHAAAAR